MDTSLGTVDVNSHFDQVFPLTTEMFQVLWHFGVSL